MHMSRMIKILCASGAVYSMPLAILLTDVAMAVGIENNANAFKGYVMEAPISHYPFLKLVKVASTDLAGAGTL